MGGAVLRVLRRQHERLSPDAAVYEHGLAYARSIAFYNKTLLWQWMRLPGDVVFALGAVLMAWDFLVKLRPLLPARWGGTTRLSSEPAAQAAE